MNAYQKISYATKNILLAKITFFNKVKKCFQSKPETFKKLVIPFY
jgi:hypothetical protein